MSLITVVMPGLISDDMIGEEGSTGNGTHEVAVMFLPVSVVHCTDYGSPMLCSMYGYHDSPTLTAMLHSIVSRSHPGHCSSLRSM